MFQVGEGRIKIFDADAMGLYDEWESPITIMSDGPYGVSGFEGDLFDHHGLAGWYEPHVKRWTEKATPQTTLWFWNTEIGWATVHPILVKHGWDYVSCNIWDKGVAHVAGNCNTKSIRRLPVVSEVCAQYVRRPIFYIGGKEVLMKEWLRHEWRRSRLPLRLTNEACGVIDAATRKYFTQCHLWYFPPAEAFEKFCAYANTHGDQKGKPYFSLDGKHPLTKDQWERMRSKFYCPMGITNVWQEPPLNGKERIKLGSKALHLNQKPLKFMRMLINISTDPGDMLWEPFGGLCSAAVAAYELDRGCLAAENNREVFKAAKERFRQMTSQLTILNLRSRSGSFLHPYKASSTTL